MKLDQTWSIVKAVDGRTIHVLGDLRSELARKGTMTLWIPRTYHLSPDSPCIDRGRSLGAPARDRDGQPRPIHRVAAGKVDVGADELNRKAGGK